VVFLGYVQVTISNPECCLEEFDDLPVDGVDGAGDVVYVAFEEGGAGAVGELWSVS
jgi:hypothetical protein